MKKARVAGLVACVLVFAGLANAGIATVENTFDYSTAVDFDGTWFIPPDVILDHSPYYRGMWEDWGWTHSLRDKIPANADGIESATLEIRAWDVDVSDEEGAEIDIIYADNVKLGPLDDTHGRNWGTTTFELPEEVLASMWADGELYVYIDIDTIRDFNGQRVTLEHATLRVNYIIPGLGTAQRIPVYRFWSPVLESHFYTALEWEKEKVIEEYPDVWTYEGEVFQAMSDANEPNSVPVYRFWSTVLGTHFYTIDEEKRDELLNEYPNLWAYETIAFYVFPVGQQPEDAVPVYRFWSEALARHFYTADESERDELLKDHSGLWAYEGVAWYVFRPSEADETKPEEPEATEQTKTE